MPYDHQASKWSDIASALAAQLVRVLSLDSSCVRVVASDRYSLYVPSGGNKLCLIRYHGPEPDTDGGAGRRARQVRRLVRVYLYTRDSADQVGVDSTALFQDGGHSDFEDGVLNAFDEFWPLSITSTPLTIEPLHPINSAEGPPVRKEEDDIGWITSHLDFECKYVARNTTPAP